LIDLIDPMIMKNVYASFFFPFNKMLHKVVHIYVIGYKHVRTNVNY